MKKKWKTEELDYGSSIIGHLAGNVLYWLVGRRCFGLRSWHVAWPAAWKWWPKTRRPAQFSVIPQNQAGLFFPPPIFVHVWDWVRVPGQKYIASLLPHHTLACPFGYLTKSEKVAYVTREKVAHVTREKWHMLSRKSDSYSWKCDLYNHEIVTFVTREKWHT